MQEKLSEVQQRISKLEALRQMGINPFPNDFAVKNTAKEITDRCGALDKEALEAKNETAILAGRIMAFRDFGKASFLHIQDRTGRIQVYIRKDLIGADAYKIFRTFDIGDIVGVEGKVFRTKTKELTIEAKIIRLLTKSLMPLPEKWHGLTSVETRYRQRYLDLIANPEVRDIFIKRTRIIQLIREFLNKMDFIEVETPMMQSIPGGAAARPFKTHHNALDIDLFLRIAPELYLKRLVIGGFERVYEINRNFRNEGISTQHNPEFTMLEFYQAYATFDDLMVLTEEMIGFIAKELLGTVVIEYQGEKIDLTPPWQRISVKDAVLKYTDADGEIFTDKKMAMAFAKKLGLNIPEAFSHGKVILEIFEHVAEPKFTQPTFVTHYPLEVSPLSRKNEKDPAIVDRFELLVCGREIANAFSELNDPIDQNERFIQQLKEKEAGDTEAHAMDEDFVRALEYGMPPTAGEGIGIDRLVMLLTNSASIRDVILFPQLRPEKS
ncbi:MAG: lysine--tRNA ligase [Deltaproteobacteria bacterium RIFCSPLOWO2_12_FULL_43_16]|nr:MAG: lysine--tRNA ligase [Deltaproteobacteria bacterium GWA2_43_19]OGQ11947.1 MAG: lysine--tRNA ligase [Deltaproteobacteria bacterium RIFCSPHIGHO2_02_FULL_43_33]OGQ61441.1 MAG: lysine--tRNA ligase [Deltaproteobacteria bacterium RIFCSPLOWO2_12_FULL_43_16]HBR18435.1 lysine--tRNA ligase [Deltaproteobacteria bacterium]